MVKINIDELNEIEAILDGYTDELNKLDTSSEGYRRLKEQLDDRFCGLNLFAESPIIHAELDIGNVIIEDDILTCIYDSKLHKFKMVKRKASNGEYAYITNATDQCPFNTKYLGRCFKVDKQPTDEMLEFVVDCVIVNVNDSEYGWLLYDVQYVVLEEM